MVYSTLITWCTWYIVYNIWHIIYSTPGTTYLGITHIQTNTKYTQKLISKLRMKLYCFVAHLQIRPCSLTNSKLEMMARQTPTSRRSPSILVTDVRNQKQISAPFVRRRLNSVSVERLLSNTSEVPSAQSRVPFNRPSKPQPRTRSRLSNAYRSSSLTSHSSRTIKPNNVDQLADETTPLVRKAPANVPRLSKALPSRTSKQSQRLVLIPESEPSTEGKYTKYRHDSDTHEQSKPDSAESAMRVTSYLISEGVVLRPMVKFLKTRHKARVRLYDEALFADYLLPLTPGDDVDYRIRSAVGDNRSMERIIDINEQDDHHFEYFSANGETNPSEPNEFSPQTTLDESNPLHAARMDDSLDLANHQSSENELGPLDLVNSKNSSGSSGSLGSLGSSNSSGSSNNNNNNSSSSAGTTNSNNGTVPLTNSNPISESDLGIERYTNHAELFIFNYGVVVFWNFTIQQEKQVLADLCLGQEPYLIHSYSDQEIECEELQFCYNVNEKPNVCNDLITLNNGSHMLKLAMSHAMAQSTVLCGFEDRMQHDLKGVEQIPKTLALTGKLGLDREELLRISGRLYKLRVDVNLSSNVLDIPDFFWDSEPSLFPLFSALREYLEIDERVLLINEKQQVFLELTSVLSDSIAEFNMDRITVIVIWLIVLSICVSLTEIIVRYYLIKR